MLNLAIAAVIAIALTPPVYFIIKAASDRLDLSPAGRLKLTERYLKECQDLRKPANYRTSKNKKLSIEDLKEYEFIE